MKIGVDVPTRMKILGYFRKKSARGGQTSRNSKSNLCSDIEKGKKTPVRIVRNPSQNARARSQVRLIISAELPARLGVQQLAKSGN